jgi:uncharacterized membrane protein
METKKDLNSIRSAENKKTGSFGYRHKLSFNQRAADRITAIVGSWKFIVTQSVLLVIWIIFNVVAWVSHWDPYPFILLNLALSFQAAFTAPIILMSQNRTAERDRRKSEMDLATDRLAEREIKQIHEHLEKIDKEKLDKILQILEKNNF